MTKAITRSADQGTPWWHREKRLVVTVILLGLAIGAVSSLPLVPTEMSLEPSHHLAQS